MLHSAARTARIERTFALGMAATDAARTEDWLRERLSGASVIVFEDLRTDNWVAARHGLCARLTAHQLTLLLRTQGWLRQEPSAALRRHLTGATLWERPSAEVAI